MSNRWSLYALSLIPAFAACDTGAGPSDDPAATDTRDAMNDTHRPDATAPWDPSDATADTRDAGPDGSETLDTSPARNPPGFAEYRSPRASSLYRAFVLAPDGRHLVTVVDLARTPASGGPPPRWALARVDTTTLEVEHGPELGPDTDTLEAWPTATPGLLWVVGVDPGGEDDGEAATLTTLDLATLTLGPSLALPYHPVMRQVTWTADATFAAFAHGRASNGRTYWEGVTLFELPPDARAFDPDTTALEERPLDLGSHVYLRVTSRGRHLVIADAPSRSCSADAILCPAEPNEPAGRVRIFDLDQMDSPVVETAGYDGNFRVSPDGRWLFSQAVASVSAIDLDAPTDTPRTLACTVIGAMSFGPDGEILCAGERGHQPALLRYGGDLALRDFALVDSETWQIYVAPDRRRVLLGAQVVDLGASPPMLHDIDLPDSTIGLRSSDDRFVWYQDNSTLARMAWSDLATETLPTPGSSAVVTHVEGLADGGYLVVDLLDPATIVVHEADGAVRGVIERVPPAP